MRHKAGHCETITAREKLFLLCSFVKMWGKLHPCTCRFACLSTPQTQRFSHSINRLYRKPSCYSIKSLKIEKKLDFNILTAVWQHECCLAAASTCAHTHTPACGRTRMIQLIHLFKTWKPLNVAWIVACIYKLLFAFFFFFCKVLRK